MSKEVNLLLYLNELICYACNGQLGLLGILGKRYHYQCRNCGMQYSKEG